MIAYDKSSAEILALAAKALGNTHAARQMIQQAYNFGRVDGGYEQTARTLDQLDVPLGAEATVTQPRRAA